MHRFAPWWSDMAKETKSSVMDDLNDGGTGIDDLNAEGAGADGVDTRSAVTETLQIHPVVMSQATKKQHRLSMLFSKATVSVMTALRVPGKYAHSGIW
jgi:hypothetical protein